MATDSKCWRLGKLFFLGAVASCLGFPSYSRAQSSPLTVQPSTGRVGVGTAFVREEYTAGIDMGDIFLGVGISREVKTYSIRNGAHFRALEQQMKAKPFDLKFIEGSWTLSEKGLTVGWGLALPMFPSPNVEFDLLSIFRGRVKPSEPLSGSAD